LYKIKKNRKKDKEKKSVYYMNFLYSLFFIVGTFSISTITSYMICCYNNYPFVNPRMSELKKFMQIVELVKNIPILLLQSVGFMYLVSDKIIPYGQHSWIESYSSMILYCIFSEGN